MRQRPRSHGGWSNDGDALLVRGFDDLPGVSLRDSLGDDGDGVDLEIEPRTKEKKKKLGWFFLLLF